MTINYSDFSLREQVRLMHSSNFISRDAQLTEKEIEDLFKEWLDQVNRLVGIFVGKYRRFSNAVFNEEDLFEEAWAVILKNMGNYDPAKADFVNYISTILSHELHDYVNERRSRSLTLAGLVEKTRHQLKSLLRSVIWMLMM